MAERESAEKHITNLSNLMETCNYGKLKEMLQDRRVVGIQDKALSEKLQMEESQQ